MMGKHHRFFRAVMSAAKPNRPMRRAVAIMPLRRAPSRRGRAMIEAL
jgi:hypothetical protein